MGGCASERSGAARMIGAPVLAARGALRAGAGLVRLVMPAPILNGAVASLASATGVALAVDVQGDILGHEAAAEFDRQVAAAKCIVVGPGLGSGDDGSDGAGALVLRACQQEDVPVVLDADGLNLISRVREFWRDLRARAIFTPHPGEFRRLAAAVELDADPVDPQARSSAAERLAQRLGVIVVLKGAGTVVSDGHRTWVCSRGHPCMATGGTGDVLSGIIGGLVAQFAGDGAEAAMLASVPEKFRAAMQATQNEARAGKPAPIDLFDCARLGVEIHARAGEAWAAEHGESGLLADELADLVPAVMEAMRS